MKTFSTFALAALLPLAMHTASAAEWYPSAYGANDEIGAANLLTPELGIGMEAAQWLADQGIVAFGGDTWASEVYPNPHGKEEFPVNQYMLAKRGIYNLELIDSRALVRDKAWEFLFVLGQPLYVGSTQVNINPVAIR